MQLTSSEESVIERLVASGMRYPVAAVAVIMASRRPHRRRDQLAHVALSGYPGLEDRATVASAVEVLVSGAWLVEERLGTEVLCRAAEDLPTRIASRLKDPEVVTLFGQRGESAVRLLGDMRAPETERAFRFAVAGARDIIRLPMLGTPSTIEAVDGLLERARAGVEVRVLLASEDVMAGIRGTASRARASESIDGWGRLAAATECLHARVSYDPAAMTMAASSSFDGVKAQLAIYDATSERSQEAVVVQMYRSDRPMNGVALFDSWFDDAWERARPLGSKAAAAWALRRFSWELLLTGSIVGVAVGPSGRVQDLSIGFATAAAVVVAPKLPAWGAALARRISDRFAPGSPGS